VREDGTVRAVIDPSTGPGYNIETERGDPLGSHERADQVPLPGDYVRVHPRGHDRTALYVVVRREFEPDNITVIVRSVNEAMPDVEGAPSPFYRQPPGSGGFT
jgi:hypothetical protein